MVLRVMGVALLAFAVMSVATSASASIIDDFNDSQALSANSAAPNDSGSALGGMLGGQRDVVADWLAGTNAIDVDVNAFGSSLLSVSLGADTMATASVEYCGIGCGGMSADLTAGGANAFGLAIPFDDLPVDIQIVAMSAGGSSALTHNSGGGIFAPTNMTFAYGDFGVTSGAGANFSDIESLQLNITPLFPGTDLQIDFLETFIIPGPSVPEPSTYAMAALGLIGLGFITRRRRR